MYICNLSVAAVRGIVQDKGKKLEIYIHVYIGMNCRYTEEWITAM
jgi:hypothetical protein